VVTLALDSTGVTLRYYPIFYTGDDARAMRMRTSTRIPSR